MAPAIPVAFLLSRKFPKRIGLGKEHPTGKEIKGDFLAATENWSA